MLSDKSSHVLKKPIFDVNTYVLFLPTSIRGLKILLYKI